MRRNLLNLYVLVLPAHCDTSPDVEEVLGPQRILQIRIRFVRQVCNTTTPPLNKQTIISFEYVDFGQKSCFLGPTFEKIHFPIFQPNLQSQHSLLERLFSRRVEIILCHSIVRSCDGKNKIS